MYPVTRARRIHPVLALVLALAACGGAPKSEREPRAPRVVSETQVGIASYYGKGHHGHKTASGERYSRFALTAAHRTFAMNTRVRVTHERSGRSVIVRINDRGPFTRGRIIDLSEAAAKELGIIRAGIARVKVERLR